MAAPQRGLSSRRNVVKGLLAAGVVGSGAAVLRWFPSTKLVGPRLLLSNVPAPVSGPSGLGSWLALASLPIPRRREFIDQATAMLTAYEARANPLLLDFTDEDPEAIGRTLSSRFLPIFSAAAALIADHWQVRGTNNIVRAVSNRAPTGNLWSGYAWTSDDSEYAARARFAAWPISYAALIEVKNADLVPQVATILSDALSKPESRIGVLLTQELQQSRASCTEHSELVVLAERARHLARRTKLPEALRALLTDIRTPHEIVTIAPWLELTRHQILVVPRLSTLAVLDQFVSELSHALAASPIAVSLVRTPSV